MALMDERLALMPDVARYKWNSQAAIEDLPRERLIIAALARQAAEAGVPAAWAESFFEAQIEAAKTVQRDLFERWRQQKAGRFEQVPDLARELRPRLDALTPLLLKALTQNWAALSDPAQRAQWSAVAQARLPAAAWGAAAAQAAAPLTDGSASGR
ncbi:gamma subclass chorismate mutase AroQ [Rugamonas sp. DEMB1]|uniref:gamma subclass chorismate mutase AroQ n=1 Tax=Rugamonas sp. DEMB1 TaxID=3039386 RepID=UPI003918AE75